MSEAQKECLAPAVSVSQDFVVSLLQLSALCKLILLFHMLHFRQRTRVLPADSVFPHLQPSWAEAQLVWCWLCEVGLGEPGGGYAFMQMCLPGSSFQKKCWYWSTVGSWI